MKPICYISSILLLAFPFVIYKSGVLSILPLEYCRTFATIVFGAFIATLAIAINAGSSAQNLSKDFPLTFRLAAQFRTPLLMFIVIPLSFITRLHNSFSAWYGIHVAALATTSHEDRVAYIVSQIKEWNKNGRKSKLRTARANWKAMSTKLSSNKQNEGKIEMPNMSHILKVDIENMTITAEPQVTMGQITHHLVPQGYALLIQVEMESITIGGVSMGFGMETNSHIIGFFQESVVGYEIVTSDGNVVKVTKESDSDLFYALPWSVGSIGFLVSVTAKITKVFIFDRC
jgi:delta24-sterol reductase